MNEICSNASENDQRRYQDVGCSKNESNKLDMIQDLKINKFLFSIQRCF